MREHCFRRLTILGFDLRESPTTEKADTMDGLFLFYSSVDAR